MGARERRKGQSGERELAAILTASTGFEVKRRVRQHAADADLEGLPGWAPEVKRHRSVTHATIAAWWAQALRQATASTKPVLFYRADRQPWRAVWALNGGTGYVDTVEADASAWWALSGGGSR